MIKSTMPMKAKLNNACEVDYGQSFLDRYCGVKLAVMTLPLQMDETMYPGRL
jgi:hypothetical protein